MVLCEMRCKPSTYALWRTMNHGDCTMMVIVALWFYCPFFKQDSVLIINFD